MTPAQKRLTRILLALGVIGGLVIGGLWRDSTRQITKINGIGFMVVTRLSSVLVFRVSGPTNPGIQNGVERSEIDLFSQSRSTLFPRPEWRRESVSPRYSFIAIPYYLILLTYLATLTLAYLFLMNRLARREALKESGASSRQQ